MQFVFKDGYNYMDGQVQMGFFLHGNGDNPTASTVVGSGDFSGEFTIGYPIAMGLFSDKGNVAAPLPSTEELYNKTTSTHWLGTVFSYGATTDRAAFDVHHRIFTGLGYRCAFKAPYFADGGETKREVLVSVQCGYAALESTEFVSGSSRTIRLNHGDIPDYDLEHGVGLEMDFRVPLNKSSYVTFGSRIYGLHDPNPWNAYIGITWSFDKLAGLFPGN